MILRGLVHLLAARMVASTAKPETAPDGVPYPRRRNRGPVGAPPVEDGPGAIRIHLADNGGDRRARRWIKDDEGDWPLLTGWGRDAPSMLDDEEIGEFTRRQPWAEFAAAMGVQ